MKTEIRVMAEGDWEAVRDIYRAGIATEQATFENDAPSWTAWNNGHLPAPRIVAVANEGVIGWAALSAVSSRSAYAGVAEVSVYVAAEMRGAGIGRLLLESLVKQSEQNGIWTLQASIFPENAASVSLHNSCGFRQVGRRLRIAKMKAVWRDTLLFERRSEIVGVDQFEAQDSDRKRQFLDVN